VRNPWVGLRPFRLADKDLFFGREREVRILGNLVATLPILVLYGPSGTGKSSLINAGLGPEIAEDDDQVAVFVDPHGDALAQARTTLAARDWEPRGDGRLDLAALLEDHWSSTGRRVAIVIDQFEERLNKGTPTDDLFSAAARLTHSGTDAACVIFSIREDYLGGLEPLMRRVPSLMDGSFRVPPLSRSALETAVYGPVEEVGGAVEVDKALVERVLDDLQQRSTHRQEPSEQRFEPGYFQIVWSALWKHSGGAPGSKLTLASYTDLGGAERILRNFTSGILDALEPAQTQLFWAISRYLVLPTGAKSSMTVKDLTSLLQTSDFMPTEFRYGYGGDPWLAAVPADRRGELIRDVLGVLTSSDAPIFQRVIRSDREEFELLHDLLGRILLDWRQEYQAAVASRTKSTIRHVDAQAQQQADDLKLRPGEPGFTERGQRLILAGTQEVAAYGNQFRRAKETTDKLALAEAADRLIVLRALVEGVKLKMNFDDYYELDRKFDQVCREIGPAMFALALDDPSERVRRTFQERIPFWNSPGLAGTTRLRISRKRMVPQLAAIIVLTIASVVLAGLIVAGPVNTLDIQYVPLTLGHLALLFGAMYVLLLIDSPTFPLRRALTRVSVPAIAARRSKRNWLFARTVPFTWPLPPILTVAMGLVVALAFDAVGWASTAGFNMGALYAGIAVAIGIAWAVDAT
jgi:hypothetical protein